jgi:hypothetical protein
MVAGDLLLRLAHAIPGATGRASRALTRSTRVPVIALAKPRLGVATALAGASKVLIVDNGGVSAGNHLLVRRACERSARWARLSRAVRTLKRVGRRTALLAGEADTSVLLSLIGVGANRVAGGGRSSVILRDGEGVLGCDTELGLMVRAVTVAAASVGTFCGHAAEARESGDNCYDLHY